MGWFNKTKTTAPEQQQEVSTAPGKLNLNFHRHSGEALRSIAAATLASGGFEESKPRDPEIGDRMPDGTIYAGISPDTGKPMYAMPDDAPLTMTFKEAVSYAKKLDAHGHRDWRLPSKEELNVLFTNRAAIGAFDVSGSNPVGWYWSGTQSDSWTARVQRFSDGRAFAEYKELAASIRCVRERLSDNLRCGLQR